jgi:putative ABC transport system ATP-binding protein
MLHATQLTKSFAGQPLFSGVDLSVAAGEVVALLGESGMGKSTLLNALAGLEPLDAGQVRVGGGASGHPATPVVEVTSLSEEACAHWRRAHLGFVFQAFHVLPHLSVAQNVGLPLLLLGRDEPARVQELLDRVGLGDMGGRSPRTLSGGQLQRVAIARALVHGPGLVLADEPTGNLDPDTGEQIIALLLNEARARQSAVVLVTHSRSAAARADRVLRLTAQGLVPAQAAA